MATPEPTSPPAGDDKPCPRCGHPMSGHHDTYRAGPSTCRSCPDATCHALVQRGGRR